jgi:hypothetical protein
MIWLSLRTQRTEMLIAAALVALLTVALVPSGLEMAAAYHHNGLAACIGAQPGSACGEAVHAFDSRFESLANTLGWLTLLPGLIGVLLAAPTILELEHGTHRLAWTQSVTRGRWVAAKLGVAVVTASAAAGILILFFTWWHSSFDHLRGRLDASAFDSEGTVAIGYALFALGLALAVGVAWRRVVPALVLAFGVYVALRVWVDVWLRQRFAAPSSATWSFRGRGPDLSHAWVLKEFPSDRLGHHIPVELGSCLDKVDRGCIVHLSTHFTHAVYQPASRFWLFQGIETALFGGSAFALIAFAAWWIHQRAG